MITSPVLRHVLLSIGLGACAGSDTHGSTKIVDAGTVDASADSGGAAELTLMRVEEIRRCLDEHWGTSESRAVSDVLDDFEACATEAENTSTNFDRVVSGWAMFDVADRSRLRRVK